MMRDADALATLKAAVKRNLEAYISDCYEHAARGTEAQRAGWQREALFGEAALTRIVGKLQAMILLAAGEMPMPQAGAASDTASDTAAPLPVLCVVVGTNEPLFTSDLAALRQVRATTGMTFYRLLNCTKADFDAYFRRERSLGRPVTHLHISAHAGPQGVQLADGIVDGAWLSERLAGVDVLLLAGCAADGVGDWLGVVPHVVTLAEEIGGADAATLTLHFWTGIGRGLDPGVALAMALERCSPVVGEFVVRHW